MSDLIKKIKIKKQDDTYTDYIPIGAEAKNVDCSDGESVEYKLNKKPYYYNSIADMKLDTNLKVGDMVVTLGYYEANDGGRAEYKIIKGTYTDDGGSIHKLENKLYAKLIQSNYVNVLQYGIKNDNSSDISEKMNTILNKYNNIFIPAGNYRVSNTIFLPNKVLNIIGEDGTILSGINTTIFKKENGQNETVIFKNITFDITNSSRAIDINNAVSVSGIINSVKIENCVFKSTTPRTTNKAISIMGGFNNCISNCEFSGVYGFYQRQAVNTTIENCRFTRCSYAIFADCKGAADIYSCGLKVDTCFILESICGLKVIANDYCSVVNTMIDYTTYPIILLGQGFATIDSCFLTSKDGNNVITIKKDTSDSNEYFNGNNTNEESQYIKIINCDLVPHCEINYSETNINQDAKCLYIENSNNISIMNCSFRYYTHYGIFFKDVNVVNVDNCRFAHNPLYSLINHPYIIDGLRNNSVNNFDSANYCYSNLFNNQGDYFRKYLAQTVNVDIPGVYRDRNSGIISIPAGSTSATINTGVYSNIRNVTLSCNKNTNLYYSGKANITTLNIHIPTALAENCEVCWKVEC